MNMRAVTCLLLIMPAFAQTLEAPADFLVKLSDSIGGSVSRQGQKVGAVIISPEKFLGGRFEGEVKLAAPGKVRIEFTAIKYRSTTIAVTTATTDFVNSIGHPAVDEQQRPLTVSEGVFVSKSPDFVLDEGAELKLRVTPVRR